MSNGKATTCHFLPKDRERNFKVACRESLVRSGKTRRTAAKIVIHILVKPKEESPSRAMALVFNL